MESSQTRALFDANAATYARTNSLLSLGLDARWRRWVAASACGRPVAKVLDAMTGTGEVAVAAARKGAAVTAVDLSPEMLRQARRRAQRAGVRIETAVLDLAIPGALQRERYDAVTLSFGLRYADDRRQLLRRLSSALTADGRLVLLEFCVPGGGMVSKLAGAYFFRIIPRLGAVFGTGPELYRCLRDTTLSMGTAEDIEGLLASACLRVIERRLFGFGLVAAFVARPVQAEEPGGLTAPA